MAAPRVPHGPLVSHDGAMPALARLGSGFIAVLLGLALAVTACSDNSDPTGPPTTVTPTDLWGTQVTASEGELWVFGGLAAADGTAPPVTSVVPPGWDPNRAVIAYSSDGQVTQRHQLPPLEHNIASGRVLGGHDDRYLLGTMCAGAGGCGRGVEPVLFRLDGDKTEEIPLRLPPAEPSDDAGAGTLLPLSATDGTAWTLQLLTYAGSGYADMADQYRLLGIDLATGEAFDGELPSGVYGEQFVCAADGAVFAAQADVDYAGLLHQVTIFAKHDMTPAAGWEPLVELPLEPRQVWTGALYCLEGLGELALALGSNPTEIHTFDLRSGEATQPATTLEGVFGPVLGVVDGAATALGETPLDPLQRWVWTHRTGGPWLRSPSPEVDRPCELVVIDGTLYDASQVQQTLKPSALALRKVELPVPGA